MYKSEMSLLKILYVDVFLYLWGYSETGSKFALKYIYEFSQIRKAVNTKLSTILEIMIRISEWKHFEKGIECDNLSPTFEIRD
jgi:hypothetical protein